MQHLLTVRSFGDKSELPLLATTALPVTSAASNTGDVLIDSQENAFESELSELAISTAANTENDGEANVGTRADIVDVDAECENVTSDSNHLASVADAEVTDELDTEDGALHSSSNCEAGTDITTNTVDVGSDSKGELMLHVHTGFHTYFFYSSMSLPYNLHTCPLPEASYRMLCSLQRL